METYGERKQSVYRVYARSFDDDRRLTLGDQALPTCLTFVADALSGIGAVLDLGCGAGNYSARSALYLAKTPLA